jgi:histidyl-tRNA synthetase
VENLRQIVGLAAGTKAEGRVRIDPALRAGSPITPGAIMEIAVADLAGSLGGGGRYDNLVGMFLGQEVPACGFSLGLERILVVMGERNMFPAALARSSADVMVSVFDQKDLGHAIACAGRLRADGLRVLVYRTPTRSASRSSTLIPGASPSWRSLAATRSRRGR